MLAMDSTIMDLNDTSKVIRRKFEVKKGDQWVETPIDKIVCGDIFRIFDGNKLVIDQNNYSEFRAQSGVKMDTSGYRFIHYTVCWTAKNERNLKVLKKSIEDR